MDAKNLNDCTIAIFQEPNAHELMRRFCRILEHGFKVSKFFAFVVRKTDQGFKFINAFAPCSLSLEEKDTIYQQWADIHKLNQRITGEHELQIEGSRWRSLAISYTQTDLLICIWKINDRRKYELSVVVNLVKNQARWFAKQEKTESLLFIDDLTGLYNYRYLEMMIAQEIKRCQRFDQSFSIIFMDLDSFKLVNDCFGHLTGSLVLKQVALTLKETLREVDTIIRYGGDEFVVLLLETNPGKANSIAERIRNAIEQKDFGSSECPIKLTVSIGISSYPENGGNKDQLIMEADLSMYSSKKAGKNQIHMAQSPSV